MGAANAAQGLDQEPVAGEDARGVAVDRARGGGAAANVAEVDDVVVKKRGGVHQLDRDGQVEAAAVEARAHPARQHHAERAEPLAAAVQEMGRALLNDVRATSDLRVGPLEAREVFLQKGHQPGQTSGQSVQTMIVTEASEAPQSLVPRWFDLARR